MPSSYLQSRALMRLTGRMDSPTRASRFFPIFSYFLLAWLQLIHQPVPVVSFTTITHLPGFQGPLPFYLETGYIVVDEETDAQLFYYFVKSDSNPAEDPLVVWLSGGPGCSSMAGLAFGVGPLAFETVEYNGSLPTLVSNPYAWTKVANFIFLDSPVGAGFSFARKPDGNLVGDLKASRQVYVFLRKWFLDHHEFLSNPLYIGGDSYGGKVVPVVTSIIAEGIEARNYPLLNLQGCLIGNPISGEQCDMMAHVPYAHGVGLIPYGLYKKISKINKLSILEPLCFDPTDGVKDDMRNIRYFLVHSSHLDDSDDIPDIGCREYGYYLCQQWANFNIVREVLHIKRGTIEKWMRCNELTWTNPPLYKIDVPTSAPYVYHLSNKGYKILVYSGDHDFMAPFLGTYEWISSFKFHVVNDWQVWMVDGQSAGFSTTYDNNLSFVTIKGGMHTATENRPKQCYTMFSRWIKNMEI